MTATKPAYSYTQHKLNANISLVPSFQLEAYTRMSFMKTETTKSSIAYYIYVCR